MRGDTSSVWKPSVMVPKFNSGSTSLDGSSIDLVGVSLSEAIVDVVGDSDGSNLGRFFGKSPLGMVLIPPCVRGTSRPLSSFALSLSNEWSRPSK